MTKESEFPFFLNGTCDKKEYLGFGPLVVKVKDMVSTKCFMEDTFPDLGSFTNVREELKDSMKQDTITVLKAPGIVACIHLGERNDDIVFEQFRIHFDPLSSFMKKNAGERFHLFEVPSFILENDYIGLIEEGRFRDWGVLDSCIVTPNDYVDCRKDICLSDGFKTSCFWFLHRYGLKLTNDALVSVRKDWGKFELSWKMLWDLGVFLGRFEEESIYYLVPESKSQVARNLIGLCTANQCEDLVRYCERSGRGLISVDGLKAEWIPSILDWAESPLAKTAHKLA